MIHYVEGNLFESPAQVLVNTVNTVGVMGKGIAKEFKRIYPEMFRQYRQLCENGKLEVGKLWLYKTPHKWVLNFPTKKHWRQPSKLSYIEAGLEKFVGSYRERGINSIAFPMLGCGNGELDWENQVKPLMEKYLTDLPIDIFIYLYRHDFTPEHRNPQEIAEWLRSQPAELPFAEVMDDLAQLLDRRAEYSMVNGSRFRARLVSDDEGEKGLLLELEDKKIHIDYGQLFRLWQVVRDKGFLDTDSLPASMHRVLGHVQTIFNELDYFRPVRIWFTDRGKERSVLTLQLVPPAREPEVVMADLEIEGKK